MFIDLANGQTNYSFDADVAIVGSGPAGLTLANRLEASGHDVLLIESGGLEYSDTAQALNIGDDAWGRTEYLRTSRIRAFGGTSFHWAGWCAELDRIDFERRPWIKDSGWPISKADLLPYYAEAAAICELDAPDFDVKRWVQLRDQPAIPFKGDEFDTSYFQLSPPVRFGQKYRAGIQNSKRITALLNATVTGVRLEANGTACKGFAVAIPNGKSLHISARRYVLAGGAIENARLLLISDDVATTGVGNSHDLVGRFFMDHPAFSSGAMIPTNPKLDLGLYVYDSHPKFRGFGTLVPTPALMEKLRSVNFNIELSPTYAGTGNSLNEAKKDYWDLAQSVRRGQGLSNFGDNLGKFFSLIGNGASYAVSSLFNRNRKLLNVDLRHHLECSPNPDSRITINKNKKDRLGQPVAYLDWQIQPSDIEGWLRGQEALALNVGGSGIGRMRIDYDPSKGMKSLNIESAWHHMGTTRMHTDPSGGVVDESCRVHGVENLYVAGSSVFPTCGDANPTLTIVALALRLGDHLKAKA